MYNWDIVRKHYIEIAEEHGPAMMSDEKFSDFYMQNLPAIMRVTTRISKSQIWDSIQIKNTGRANIIDMVASLFMGMSIPLKKQQEVDITIDSIKDAVDTYSSLDDEELTAILGHTMQLIIQNLNDVLAEFQVIASSSANLHYLEVIKIMYLTGLFMGNAFMYASVHPEGSVESSTNIFAAYIMYLKDTFDKLETGRKQ